MHQSEDPAKNSQVAQAADTGFDAVQVLKQFVEQVIRKLHLKQLSESIAHVHPIDDGASTGSRFELKLEKALGDKSFVVGLAQVNQLDKMRPISIFATYNVSQKSLFSRISQYVIPYYCPQVAVC